jgi:hypothetical protein
MCRYAMHNYKPHLACFRCRKVFRRRLGRDVGHHGPDKPAVCPECGGPMANMGLDFKTPPHDDVKNWQLAEELWTIGATFHSCGCSGPGYRPRDMPAYRAFLVERHREYVDNLRHWLNEARAGTKDSEAAVARWRDRIAAIEDAMQRVGVEPSVTIGHALSRP